MSTRSFIGRLNSNGTITAIYCHSDGYPEHVGTVLTQHYREAAKVEALLALGFLSILGEVLGGKIPFGTRDRGNQCLAYGRDRGDTGVEALQFKTKKEFFEYGNDMGAEYWYIFRSDGENTGTWFRITGPMARGIPANRPV